MTHNQRLRRDARLLAGDYEALALFECLAEHVFNPALDATFMGRVCGAPRAVRERLAAKLGPLGKYVTKLRMAEAKRLMCETDLPVSEVARRVGYGVVRTFRRNFGEAHGMSPREMRRRARSGGGAAETDPAPESESEGAGGEPEVETAEGRRAQATSRRPRLETVEGPERRATARRIGRRRVLGMLDARRAAELRLRLRRLHHRLEEREEVPGQGEEVAARGPVVLTPTGDWLEERAANSAIGDVLELPEEERRFALLEGLRLGNLTALRQFRKFCRWLLRWDAEEAVRTARLAVELVGAHPELLGDEGADWKAMAWIDLGHIQAQAGDFGGADQSLGFARAEVAGDQALKPWVEIELRRLEGMIHRRQRRYRQAARALDRAVELGRGLEAGHPDRRRTVLARLDLASSEGDTEAGIALIRELAQLLEAGADGVDRTALWRGLVLFHGARAHAAGGNPCRARGWLQRALRDLAADPRCETERPFGVLLALAMHDMARLWDHRLDFSEGLLRLAAESYRGFEMPVLEAAAEAELAVVCALLGRRAEARRLAASAADFLDDLPSLHREAWSASRRLRALAEGGTPPDGELMELLAALRAELDLAAWEITDPQARAVARARGRQAGDGAPGQGDDRTGEEAGS